MDKDGDIYFVEGKYKKGETDENGFSTGYSLYKYALKNSDKSEITKANTYYISDGKLYFTRLCGILVFSRYSYNFLNVFMFSLSKVVN